MAELPFITIEEIGENKFMLRFFGGKEIVINWEKTGMPGEPQKVTMKDMVDYCHWAIVSCDYLGFFRRASLQSMA